MQLVIFIHDSFILIFEWFLVLTFATNLFFEVIVDLFQFIESFCSFEHIV